jgi:hypothetical protein
MLNTIIAATEVASEGPDTWYIFLPFFALIIGLFIYSKFFQNK